MNLKLTITVHYPGDGNDKLHCVWSPLYLDEDLDKYLRYIKYPLQIFPKKSLDVASPFNIKHNLREF